MIVSMKLVRNHYYRANTLKVAYLNHIMLFVIALKEPAVPDLFVSL